VKCLRLGPDDFSDPPCVPHGCAAVFSILRTSNVLEIAAAPDGNRRSPQPWRRAWFPDGFATMTSWNCSGC
jgi:hypothetical protein